MQPHRLKLMISLFLILATLAVYGQMRNHDFINFDDNDYVIENRYVLDGLTWKGLVWAFTTVFGGHWYPLTWLSHMMDCQLFGLNPGWHHLTSMFIHIANTVLLFLVFNRMTGKVWRSAFVAALFGLHTLHVESVAWVSDRKDLLSTFFWVLTMWSYIRYVEHPRTSRYLYVIVFFALGLMSKATLVTLPFVLLLLDYWPLRRFEFRPMSRPEGSQEKSLVFRLIWEKAPLFLMLASASIVTYFARVVAYLGRQGVEVFNQYPLDVRMANALVSYVRYVAKMIWPWHLTVFYPHPSIVPGWQVFGAITFLLSVSMLAISIVRSRPYVAIGWFWYLGTLVPVIGLVQVGSYALADRYTYVPSIGLFIIVAWTVPELVAGWRQRTTVLAVTTGIVLSVLMINSWRQVRYWKNSVILFTHTLDVTAGNWLAHNNLGNALAQQGKLDKAIAYYSEALRIAPDFAMAHNNLGFALAQQGKTQEAVRHYTEALQIDPGFWEAHSNLGGALASQGRFEEAIGHFSEALRLQPKSAVAHNNLGDALARQGHLNGAMEHFLEALRIDPSFAKAHYNLGFTLTQQGRLDEAIRHYTQALEIKSDLAPAHNNLGIVLARQGKLDEAMHHFSEALRISPDFAEARRNLRRALQRAQHSEKASKRL